MIEKTATIINEHGIHCRPSAMIVRAVADYEGTIHVSGERGATALHSIMELMAMELHAGASVRISVSGPDEEHVCDRLVALFETEFDFPPA